MTHIKKRIASLSLSPTVHLQEIILFDLEVKFDLKIF